MSERKVLQKYYPPTFDPSAITRTKKPKGSLLDKKLPTVRLMAPFPMRCTSCGEFIYKGRKFNARKETTDEKYLDRIAIYRFWIKCTACSSAISFRTNPRTMDYDCESGAQRSFERWRDTGEENANAMETEEEMLDRLEAEAAESGGGQGAMGALERKVEDARTEMEIADALDEIRTRNARIQRVEDKGGKDAGGGDGALEAAERARVAVERERRRVEEEDERAARRAFGRVRGGEEEEGLEVVDEGGKEREKVRSAGGGGGSKLRNEIMADEDDDDSAAGNDGKKDDDPPDSNTTTTTTTASTITAPAPPPTFKRVIKKKKDFSAALGIKKKPALV